MLISISTFAQTDFPYTYFSKAQAGCDFLDPTIDTVKFNVVKTFRHADPDTLILEVKKAAIKQIFTQASTNYNNTIINALVWHAGQLVKIKTTDMYQKKSGINELWYIEKFAAYRKAILQIAQNINDFYQKQAVVLYNPCFFKNDIDYAQYLQKQLQAAYVNSTWGRNSVLNLDYMPPCSYDCDDLSAGSYYKQTVDCIINAKKQQDPKTAIVVRDYMVLNQTGGNGGNDPFNTSNSDIYTYQMSFHIQVWSFELEEMIVDTNITGNASNPDSTLAKKLAFDNAIDENIEALIKEETRVYYIYTIHGRRVSISIPSSECECAFETELADSMPKFCIKVDDIFFEDTAYIFTCHTPYALQKDILKGLGGALKAADLLSKVTVDKIKGNKIILKQKPNH